MQHLFKLLKQPYPFETSHKHKIIIILGLGPLNKRVLISTMILALFLSSCSNAPENLASRAIIDGIEYVHNASVPLHPDITLSIEEELSIGGEDDEGNIILYAAAYVIVDNAENMYIVDRRDFKIKVFDPQGNFIRSIGKQGEGPGEFQQVGYISFVPDGRLLVMDFQARRTSLFDKTGEFISSHQWIKSFSQPVLATNSSYFVQEFIREEGSDPIAGRKLIVDEIDFEGDQLQSIGGFKLPEYKVHSEGDMMFGMRIPHSPRSIFAGDLKNQCFYHCLNNYYLIDVYDTTGNIFRKIDRPYDALSFTNLDKEQFLNQYADRPDRQKKIVASMDFPSIKNIAASLITDDKGNLWVQTYEIKEEEGEKSTAYDIFSQDGSYVRKIWLKMRPEIIHSGKMYTRYTDEETGHTYIKRFKMIWSD